jgi:hypothetical protein
MKHAGLFGGRWCFEGDERIDLPRWRINQKQNSSSE